MRLFVATAAMVLAACGADESPAPPPAVSSSPTSPSPFATSAAQQVCDRARAATTPRAGYTPDPDELAAIGTQAQQSGVELLEIQGAILADTAAVAKAAKGAADEAEQRRRMVEAVLRLVELCRAGGH